MTGEADFPVTPDILLRAYAAGVFPMAESADDPGLHWIEPKLRGVIPLDRFHLPSRLARLLRQNSFDIVADRDFDAVIAACAAPRGQEGETWINGPIRRLYRGLFDRGFCHTIEVRHAGELVGGLYGVSIGAAFFGESMFHKERDCSKLALAHLVARLRAGGFELLDTQFVTPHLAQFGAIEIPRAEYRRHLARAIQMASNFAIWPLGATPPMSEVFAALGHPQLDNLNRGHQRP
ncbi:Aat Leu/Phe-tRNA-protein transferase [Rhabdaerophilaceae bacterium]